MWRQLWSESKDKTILERKEYPSKISITEVEIASFSKAKLSCFIDYLQISSYDNKKTMGIWSAVTSFYLIFYIPMRNPTHSSIAAT